MYRFQIKLIECPRNSWLSKWYHSKFGVYGYRPKKPVVYEIYLKVPANVLKSRQRQCNIYRWIQAYRTHGHRVANINPVELRNKSDLTIPELDVSRYGISLVDNINYEGLVNVPDEYGTISMAKNYLNRIYCGTVSAEMSYISNEAEREWLIENYECLFNGNSNKLSSSDKIEISDLLIKSQAWDNFVATKFPTVKRYGGEGAESMLAFFRQLLLSATETEIDHIVLSMPHRGKLNLLTTMLHTRPAKIFRKFKGLSELPDDAKAMCDIANHFHVSEDLYVNGKKIRFSMLHNPSHLEAANPVSMGKTRSRQQVSKDGAFSDDIEKQFANSALNIQLHGDAAFVGQGINQEMLMMAGTPHFDIGGTIHMVVNNQVGFTTPAERGRVTAYSTDLAKSIEAPIFHVNGDDPESLTYLTKLAFEYNRKFRKDIFIDLNCFRRWGHNEIDNPTFTNPALYEIIHSRKSIPDLYAEKLIQENVREKTDIENVVRTHMDYLKDELNNTDSYQPEAYYFHRQWTGIEQAPNAITYWDTGLDYDLLKYIGEKSVYFPNDFSVHPHLLKTHINSRLNKLTNGKNIDWATAEALALGSLMYQGHNVRISGEDVGRGTFSQRHAMLVDQKSNEMYIPLNSINGGNGGKFEVANSILSEEAVLAFEYGMAMDNPHNLIIWEAQFGDFFNGAQIIIDTFITSGETKWMMSNGLVMLLPHGYDGAASEHSSCRIERFLQQTDSKEILPDGDDVNFHVINPTTPAQYFHALRRQIIRNFRKPLIVIAPKTLLRLSDATSTHREFEPGTIFRSVIGDDYAVTPDKIKKVLLCSGKHYYNLRNERNQKNHNDVAIIRIESLCPFPVQEINTELSRFKNAKTFIWSQEEHRNMGAWSFIKPRFENMCGNKIKYCGRFEGGTPAVGVASWHRKEADYVVYEPFRM